jgi:uncharacterized hydrophobic protein (TIGR00271 family)
MQTNFNFVNFLKDRFNLGEEQAGTEDVAQSIRQSIYFRGTNLWVLIFAIFIASLGLNMNSTAVIIGAMLISPLMGPIMGIGLGVGINDFKLIKTAAWNFLIAIIISLFASTLYFWMTPLSEAHSELLARTTPTVYDVLIALFGGLAGIVATSSKSRGNVIPGVAIATALMPPLCTAGYGIAVGNLYYFGGALYLFFINSVFICLATLLIIRFLRFPVVHYPDPSTARRVRIWITLIVILTLLPSVYIAYRIVGENIYETNASRFITSELNFPGSVIINRKIDPGSRTIEVVMVGKPIGEDLIVHARTKLVQYGLNNTQVKVNQGDAGLEVAELASMKSEIIEELYQKNQALLVDKEERIRFLESEIGKNQLLAGTLGREIQALVPDARELSITRTLMISEGSKQPDTVYLAYIKLSRKAKSGDIGRMENWLKQRLPEHPVKLVLVK